MKRPAYRYPLAKLTDDQVREIRQHKLYHGVFTDFARKFGVSPSVVRDVWHRYTYRRAAPGR